MSSSTSLLVTTENPVIKEYKVTPEDLKKLPKLVDQGNLDEIRMIMYALKITYKDFRYYTYLDKDKDIRIAFRDAILKNRVEITRFFILEAKIDLNECVPGENEPYIYYAVKSGNLPLVQLLVENGADIRSEHNGYGFDLSKIAILTAVREGHTDITEYLLSKGANPHGYIQYPFSFRRSSFVEFAASKNDIRTVEVLIKYGALKEPRYLFGGPAGYYNKEISECHSQIKYIDNHSNADYFSDQRSELLVKLSQLQCELRQLFLNLMDYAVGCDISYEIKDLFENVMVADINFVGVSFNGQPVTREMLYENLILCSSKAIVTLSDLEKLPDVIRKNKIKEQCNNQIGMKGSLIRNDVINLVSLSEAAAMGDIEAVKVRLAAGCDPNELVEATKEPAIVVATKNGHEEVVMMLATHPNVKSIDAAIEAAAKTNREQLKLKLKAIQPEKPDAKGNYKIHYAVDLGDVAEVKRLIDENKANVNLKGSLGYPICIAARKSYDGFLHESSSNHLEIIELLLANQAEHKDALFCAAAAGSSKAVKLLLPQSDEKAIKFVEKKVWYTNIRYSGYSNDFLEILQIFKMRGVTLNRFEPQNENSLLHVSMSKFFGIINSPFSDKDSNQKVKLRFYNLIDFLIENKVSHVALDYDGDTPLHHFFRYLQNPEIDVCRIVDKFKSIDGFDINAKNKDGKTVLHFAAYRNLQVIKDLISRGASLEAKDKNGETPWDIIQARKLVNSQEELTNTPTLIAEDKMEVDDRLTSGNVSPVNTHNDVIMTVETSQTQVLTTATQSLFAKSATAPNNSSDPISTMCVVL